jgi:uncharacterized small protein (DUF1192 family)
MHIFKDEEGRDWKIAINVTARKDCRAHLGLDLFGLTDDSCKPLGELVSDPERLSDVLFVLCMDQAKELGITDRDFGRLIFGDAIERAVWAFTHELFDFFSDAAKRAALRKWLEKAQKVASLMTEQIATEMETELERMDPEKIATQEIARMKAERLRSKSNGRSGDTPASSGSTPALSPSQNSP